MKNLHGISIVLALVTLIFIGSCGQGGQKSIDETPTRGDIKIAVDESFQQLVDTQIYTFQSLYTYAKIQPLYKPEADVISAFMKDSVRTMLITRKLTKAEEDWLLSQNFVGRSTLVAYDAIAFVMNNENADSLINYNAIRDICNGKIKIWQDVNAKSKLGDIKVVFDNAKSGAVRLIKERFNLTQFPANFYAVSNNNEVINFVEKNKNSIGIIGVNWISDVNDTVTHNFMNRVKVAAISSQASPDTPEFFKPLQGFIYNKNYPFVREVYMVGRETFAGLGYGFTSFVAGEIGQRIILKSGLVPATMPIRLIQTKKDFN